MKLKLMTLKFCLILFLSLKMNSVCQSEKLWGQEELRKGIETDNFVADIFSWLWGEKEKKDKAFNPFTHENIQGLEQKLRQRIVGQEPAIKSTVSAIERYVYELNERDAPIASLLYVGPTGVGKTHVAKELAKILLGSEQRLLRLNMAEYAHASAVNRLIGSALGYSGYEKGGLLIEALKQNPYAIILIDEIEKAHPAVLKIFLQIFDEGCITDGQGRLINCRNTLFILTTNLEGQKILTMQELGYQDQEILEATQSTLIHSLSPEFYNRLEAIIFRGFKADETENLVKKLLEKVTRELLEKRHIHVEFDPSVVHLLKEKTTHYLLGAHPLKHRIHETLLTAIKEAFKENYLSSGDEVRIVYQNNYFIIQNDHRDHSFIWLWKEEEKAKPIPFQLHDLLHLEEKLQKKIIGQPHAIQLTMAALIRYAAGLGTSKSPIGSFLYVGPTGVGKTQLAKELAVELLGSESQLIRLDMSEYVEPYSLMRLIGSPPGYANHEQGGELTEALKQQPYAVVLLDEIEKAHPLVLKTLLQIFDEGRLVDSKGVVIDCSQVIFIATTHLTAAKILSMHAEGYEEQEILESIQSELAHLISPELYNRLEVAIFMGLGAEWSEKLVHKMLQEVVNELKVKKKIQVSFDASLIDFLKQNGFDYALGARPLKRLIQQQVLTAIAKEMMWGHLQAGDVIKLFYRKGEIIIEKNAIFSMEIG